VVTDPGRIRLDDDEVESRWERRQGSPVRERARRNDRPGSVAEVAALPEVDGLLGESERARPSGPDLDDHEAGRRARVDREDVQLVMADADIPGEDRPALLGQPFGDEGLGAVADPLRRRARTSHGRSIHEGIVAWGA